MVKQGKVALLAEGVDRNAYAGINIYQILVALLAEGVDRNFLSDGDHPGNDMSPSSRRAWIEMPTSSARWTASTVALLAEGVDRNVMV